jgi:hypothetical protein
MSHLVDHLTSGLSVAEVPPSGVREQRYGGVDEDTQFTPPAAGPKPARVELDALAAVGIDRNTYGHAFNAATRAVEPGTVLLSDRERIVRAALLEAAPRLQAGPKPAAATVRLVDLEAALRSAHHCPASVPSCICETDEWDDDFRGTRDAVVAFLRGAGVGVDERRGDAWDTQPTPQPQPSLVDAWLEDRELCGHCDAQLPMPCTCPPAGEGPVTDPWEPDRCAYCGRRDCANACLAARESAVGPA